MNLSGFAVLAPLLFVIGCSAPESAPSADSPVVGERPTRDHSEPSQPEALSTVEVPADTIRRPRPPVGGRSRALCDGPGLTRRTVEPNLEPEQRRVLTRHVSERYPAELLASGEASRVVLWVCIDAEGWTRNTAVVVSSGHAAFDQLAGEAVRAVRFTPALNRGEPVAAWAQIAVVYP